MVFYNCLGIISHSATEVQRGIRPNARPAQTRKDRVVDLVSGQVFKAVITAAIRVKANHRRLSGWNTAPCVSAYSFSSCIRLACTLLSTKG